MEDDWKAVVDNIDKEGNLIPIKKKIDDKVLDFKITISDKR